MDMIHSTFAQPLQLPHFCGSSLLHVVAKGLSVIKSSTQDQQTLQGALKHGEKPVTL